jgi:hypothetical protein
MHGIGARPARHVDDTVDPQVALGSLCRPNRIRLVGKPYVQRIAIAFRVDGNRAEAHVAARPNDSYGNLAAVGDKQLVQVVKTSGSASVILSPAAT